jgi:hypothetical protein
MNWLGYTALGFLLGLGVGQCSDARADTMTFLMNNTACANGTVSRKGNDVLLRCDGVLWFTITNSHLSCPNLKVTYDAKGKVTTVRCP